VGERSPHTREVAGSNPAAPITRNPLAECSCGLGTGVITAETGDLGSLVELVAEGLGVAVLPRSATEGADVTVLRITRPRLQRRTALAWNQANVSPAGRAFLTLAEKHFSATPATRSKTG
jgi:DNA-binding transcriptional LysR family regulator